MSRWLRLVFIALIFVLPGCKDKKVDDTLRVGIATDYPPFEYKENGELVGFDVDLARLLAKEMEKEVSFVEMRFRNTFDAIKDNSVDVVISTVTTSQERRKDYEFSRCYYSESLAAVYEKNEPYLNAEELAHAKLACQLGTTAERWIKEHVQGAQLVMMDNPRQLIDALKAGHVDCVVIDGLQAREFCRQNPALANSVISQSDEGYAVLMKKQSLLKEKVNIALRKLETTGELGRLKAKWLEN
ncbi:MAG: ABC transporter substrate-binding protein [Holosporaceae bacterium]|jgi:polar amino acid transport system substrate-binding protein|nr:ABC transporter substrate-binding protein [Holosporaceae bacterium]